MRRRPLPHPVPLGLAATEPGAWATPDELEALAAAVEALPAPEALDVVRAMSDALAVDVAENVVLVWPDPDEEEIPEEDRATVLAWARAGLVTRRRGEAVARWRAEHGREPGTGALW